MTIVEAPRAVTGGVDTHLDLNVAAALDDIGGLLGVEEFATDADGNVNLKWPHRDDLKWPHPGTRCITSRHGQRSA